MRAATKVGGILLAAALAGCAAVDGSVAPRYDTLSRNFADARNQGILLNIVRAAHDYPLSFAAISQAIPSLANTTTFALPSFLAGPKFCPAGPSSCTLSSSGPQRDVVFGNNTASNATNIQTQFTLSTQETKDFYDALLRPVDLYILSYFIRQGYSRELLFWLFADSVQVFNGRQAYGYTYDPPYSLGCALNDPHHHCFRDWAEIATITGLTVEEISVFDKETKKKEVLSRFCFNPILAAEGRSAMAKADPLRLDHLQAEYLPRIFPNELSPKCGSPWPSAKLPGAASDTLEFSVGPLKFRIVPRSAYGIYEFLGRLLRQQLRPNEIDIPASVTQEQVLPQLSTVIGDPNILKIELNSPGPCFVRTSFTDGEYCVPEEGAENTTNIFGLLAQLTALQTTASDLAITPVVHVAD
jgi:hypothetical protein